MKTVFHLAAVWFAATICLQAEDKGTPGYLVQFKIHEANPKVLLSHSLSLPDYALDYRPISKFESQCAYYPVRSLGATEEQIAFLRKIGDGIPFGWDEKSTEQYLVFKAIKIKEDTYLLQLDKDHPSAKKVGELKGDNWFYLPTDYKSNEKMTETPLYKHLHAGGNAAVEKEILDAIASGKLE